MRRIAVELSRWRVVQVVYREPPDCPYEVRWYLANGIGLNFDDDDVRRINGACLHDLLERRRAWCMALEAKNRRRA